MGGYGLSGDDRLLFGGRPEEQSQHNGGDDSGAARNEEQTAEIYHSVSHEGLANEFRSHPISDERPEAEDHEVEQTLRAGARVLWKILIHEDVYRGEKEGVTDPVQDLHQNDERWMLREIGIHREARRVTENADDHGRPPPELFESHAEHDHCE